MCCKTCSKGQRSREAEAGSFLRRQKGYNIGTRWTRMKLPVVWQNVRHTERWCFDIQKDMLFRAVLFDKLNKNLSYISPRAKIPVVNKFHSKFFILCVSLDICKETQKGQSTMWILGGFVEVRNDLVSREAVSRVLVCRKA